MDSFISKLTEIDWSPITQNNACQDAYTMFHSIFIKEYDKWFPYKVVKVNYRTKKPWLLPALKISIKKKNKLYKTFIKNPTFTNEIAYKNHTSKYFY